MPLHEKWSQYTRKEIDTIKKNVCIKHDCPYLGRLGGGYLSTKEKSQNFISSRYCNYADATGQLRGCFPEDCKYWKDKKKTRKRKQPN